VEDALLAGPLLVSGENHSRPSGGRAVSITEYWTPVGQ